MSPRALSSRTHGLRVPRPRPIRHHGRLIGGLIALLLVLSGTLGAAASQATPEVGQGATITAAGSATLGPVLEAAAEAFAEEADVTVTVDRTSSGDGI